MAYAALWLWPDDLIRWPTPSKPTILDYCIKDIGTGPSKICLESKQLSIPVAFGKPSGAENWKKIELAYPSMLPWRSLSRAESKTALKLTVQLRGLSWGTTKDDFRVMSLGTPKPVRQAAIYGLDQYLRFSEAHRPETLLLLPIEENPRVFIYCYTGPNFVEVDPTARGDHSCTTTIYSPWHLLILINHGEALIPEWQILHSKVQSFIESLIVTP